MVDKKRTVSKVLVMLLLWVTATTTACLEQVQEKQVKIFPVTEAWANNSVNAVIFRRNSLVSYKNTQYAAFYDADQFLVLAKRKQGADQWTIKRTAYKGNAADAHNSISIMVDGKGYLHVSWDHHNTALRYARSTKPGELVLGQEMAMTGLKEDKISYPEFYSMPGGDLLFFYRYGASGDGDMVINQYNVKTQQWTQVQDKLIDGQGERNAYWQSCVDEHGTIHVSWVWRESWDVATNHDLSYARSRDGGKSWENSKGETYTLPITLESAEIAWAIPQNSELINQTSMTTDSEGNPMIATYWREEDSEIPQYQLVYNTGSKWKKQQVTSRSTPFSLSGGGTKQIPISRPQVLSKKINDQEKALLVFRDEERGDKVSLAVNKDFPEADWEMIDLSPGSVGSWEPSYDTELWKEKGILNLFVQKVEQVDGEGLASSQAEMVKVLEWVPAN